MNNPTLELICEELAATLVGRRVGRIFQLSKLGFAIDFRDGSRFLFVSADPNAPRLFLVNRRLRDIEKQSLQQLAFAQFLKKRISGANVVAVEKLEGERVVKIRLRAQTELGETAPFTLVVQLTGRSSNLFLLDGLDRILDRLRDTYGDGQEIATVYAPPERAAAVERTESALNTEGFGSISEALDAHYLAAGEEAEFKRLAGAARAKLKQAAAKCEKLAAKLRADLAAHGDPAIWKRSGDLILANLSEAAVVDGRVLVVDYFDDATPVVEIEIDENDELTVAAERFFKRYSKARNAREELNRRLSELESTAASLQAQKAEIEERIEDRDVDYLAEFLGDGKIKTGQNRTSASDPPAGTRRFISPDGFEILVGKGAKDNDQLTFRVARSSDLWLHAADYPGSHVIVRNPSRGEIPPATVLEAAKLAAFYSQAREHPKAAVHYTLRKNVHKPRGGVPGLVSLTNFKTILVKPEIRV